MIAPDLAYSRRTWHLNHASDVESNVLRGMDLFCGAGGSSLGARGADIELVCSIDMDQIATATYRDNFPNAEVVNKRLEDVSLPSLKKAVGSVDVILASPECTNHTCAKGSAPRSEASRATALSVVEYAKVFRPRWLVIENVVQMRPWSRYGEFKSALEALGYHLGEQILNAMDFGVPQSRRRLFLVGDLKGPPNLVTYKQRGPKRSVRSILDPVGSWPTTPLRIERRAADTLARADRAIANVGGNEPFLIVYYGTDGSGGWQALNRPLRTITTVDRFALVRPTDDGHVMRMLQVPELRTAMGFDRSYKFEHGTRRDKVRLLGNGVCPPVMKKVVEALTRD